MMEATISGSIANVVTLRIPTISLYALHLASGKASKDSAYKVELGQIKEPLYREVDSMGGLVATARIARETPPFYESGYVYQYQTEPDGDDYTIVRGPKPLKLWENRRTLVEIEVSDLPRLGQTLSSTGTLKKHEAVAIWSEVPFARQLATFSNQETAKEFLDALDRGSIGLVERTVKLPHGSKELWYRVVNCCSVADKQMAATESSRKPAPGEIWLGVEGTNSGIIGGLPTGLQAVYRCDKSPWPLGMDPCSPNSVAGN